MKQKIVALKELLSGFKSSVFGNFLPTIRKNLQTPTS